MTWPARAARASRAAAVAASNVAAVVAAVTVMALPAGAATPPPAGATTPADAAKPSAGARTPPPPRPSAAASAPSPSSPSSPSFDAVRASASASDAVLLDRHGQPLHRLRRDATVRRGSWVPLDDVSDALVQALLAGEDRHFMEHAGVDWAALGAAAWSGVRGGPVRGASTITMQLVGLLDPQWVPGARRRGLSEKWSQIHAARALERHWSKRQILEAYLNLVPFRGELVGIDALSRSLFGRAAHALDPRQAAIAAVLVRAPNADPAQVARRVCALDGAADCTVDRTAMRMDLNRRAWRASDGIAPHVARRLLAGAAPGARVRSTLDARVQRRAVELLDAQMRALGARHVRDGAVVVLDNASGEVLAWVGSSGTDWSRADQLDHVLRARQPGSALKPLLYAQALGERRLTAASLLEDEPTQRATSNGLYVPANHDRRFHGWVSVRTALASSLNVPAVRVIDLVTPAAFHRQLQMLGLSLPQQPGYYGASLALGSAEVSLVQLANAYRTLANGGRHGPWTLQPAAGQGAATGRDAQAGTASASAGQDATAPPSPRPAATPVLDPGAAAIVADILRDDVARTVSFGTHSVLQAHGRAAVKTGTSSDMRDNWAIGFTDCCTIGVWVGNAEGDAMHEVSGTTGAAPVWAGLVDLVQELDDGHAGHAADPAREPGLQHVAVHYRHADGTPGPEPDREEWFLPGTAQPEFVLADDARPRITAPVDGTIVALDPDIPPANQTLALTSTVAGARWRVDGRPVDGAGSRAAWPLWPGRHRLTLHDADGRALDAIGFEVRGAVVRDASPPFSGPSR